MAQVMDSGTTSHRRRVTITAALIVLLVAFAACAVSAGFDDTHAAAPLMHLCLGMMVISTPLVLLTTLAKSRWALPSASLLMRARPVDVLLPPPKLRFS